MSEKVETVIRKLNVDELHEITYAILDFRRPDDDYRSWARDLAQSIADQFDIEVEVDEYGKRCESPNAYTASRWVTPWSKDQ